MKKKMKKTAYRKDILRTVTRGKKRFLSILIITALGVIMFTGLRAACVDLRRSADAFMDEQNLYDIMIQSTLGLTEDDVAALAALEGVSQAEGGYSETVYLTGDSHESVLIKVISQTGMSEPYLVEGTLPTEADEIAVTQGYLDSSGKSIGDTLTIEEIFEEDDEEEEDEEEDAGEEEESEEDDEDAISIDIDIDTSALEEEEEEPTFYVTEFTITAIVTDPADINNPDSSTTFRITSSTDYTFFVAPAAVNTDIYTAVYLTVDGAIDLNCYTDAYTEAVAEVIDAIEAEIKEEREAARTEEVIADAEEQIADAEQTMNDAFAEVDEQIADAEEELADARQQLDDGWEEYYNGLQELEDGQAELEDGIATLESEEASAREQIAEARQEIEDGQAEIDAGYAELAENEALVAENQAALDEAIAELTQTQADTEAQIADGEAQLAEAQAEVEATIALLEAQIAEIQSQLPSWPTEEFDALVAAAASGGDTDTASEALTSSLSSYVSLMQASLDTANAQLTALQSSLAEAEAALAEAAAAADDSDDDDTAEDSSEDEAEAAAVTDGEDTADSNTANDTSALEAQIAELTEQIAVLEAQIAALTEQLASFETLIAALPQLAIGLGQAQAGLAEIEAQAAALAEQKALAEEEFAAAWATIEESQAQLTAAAEELASGRAQLDAAQEELDAGLEELNEQEALAEEEFAEAWATIEESEQELADGLAELADGLAELEDGEAEYADGAEQLADGIETYQTERADAEQQLADAKAELADLDEAVWYVQDRTSLSGYANIDSDSGAIEAIGTAFPVVFLAVAILISLTTITRMVEEERGLIGTYKALGFSDGQVLAKYLVFSLTASLAGSLVGAVGGFILLPEIVFIIFSTMYTIPTFSLSFDPLYGLLGPAIFLFGVGLASWFACKNELKQQPATLMRPKSPAMGSKVFLEHIPVIWTHLSFLNKVTARNLFRYKKRLLMTVAGILGCTALLVCGFAIKDTVTDLLPKQYEQVYQYDLLAVATDNDTLLEEMEASEEIESYLNVRIDTVTIEYDGSKASIQLIVVPDEDAELLAEYISITDIDSGEALLPENGGILVTRNAGQMLGFSAGDTVSLQDLTLTQGEVTVTAIVENYLGNNVYITQTMYEELFGEYEANGVIANLTDDCEDPIAWADELSHKDDITNVTATEQLREEFSKAFVLINMVVYIIIIMAAALAFVVLFTLSTTNISEREREIATIKVLGFFDHEVHLYVNKETILLTILGILPGLVAGTFLGHAMTAVLNMPSLYFDVSIFPVSYLYSGGLTLIFALLVQQITNRILNKVDPVEALKSVE